MCPPLQDQFFADASGAAEFQLHKYPNLKPAHVFSRKFGVADSSLQASMLRYQAEPIHTSLTAIADKPLRRTAVKVFRQVQAFMGDRPVAKPAAIAQDIMQECLTSPELRDETYLQIIKQLRDNPSSASLDRGWVLLHVCLQTFPPSEDAENFVEYFLRTRSARVCVRSLHRTLFRGAASAPLDANSIEDALDHAALSGVGAPVAAPAPTLALPPAPVAAPAPPAAPSPAVLFSSSPTTRSPHSFSTPEAPPPPARSPPKPDVRGTVITALLTPPLPPSRTEDAAPAPSASSASSATSKLRVTRPPGPPPPEARKQLPS